MQIDAWTINESHLPRLIELGRTYYPSEHHVLTEEFLRWFYLRNPAGPATLVVAHEEDVWIGIIVLIPVMLQRAGQLQKACYAVNVLTHPKHRGKNLFVKLISHATSALSQRGIWLLGHPNNASIAGWRRQKMQFRDPLQLHFAKFRLPFSSLRETPIENAHQLQAISLDFWKAMSNRDDVHLQYTPEFIEWRYLRAPHRKYSVAAVEKRGHFFGLRVTRHFKGAFDLMVDFVGLPETLGYVVSNVRKPTLVMHPGCGSAATALTRGCWRPPIKRQFAFFVTTWDEFYSADMSGITLAASDF